jgi:hypothetical protein
MGWFSRKKSKSGLDTSSYKPKDYGEIGIFQGRGQMSYRLKDKSEKPNKLSIPKPAKTERIYSTKEVEMKRSAPMAEVKAESVPFIDTPKKKFTATAYDSSGQATNMKISHSPELIKGTSKEFSNDMSELNAMIDVKEKRDIKAGRMAKGTPFKPVPHKEWSKGKKHIGPPLDDKDKAELDSLMGIKERMKRNKEKRRKK